MTVRKAQGREARDWYTGQNTHFQGCIHVEGQHMGAAYLVPDEATESKRAKNLSGPREAKSRRSPGFHDLDTANEKQIVKGGRKVVDQGRVKQSPSSPYFPA